VQHGERTAGPHTQPTHTLQQVVMNELPTVVGVGVEDRRIENDFPAEFSYFNVVIATRFWVVSLLDDMEIESVLVRLF